MDYFKMAADNARAEFSNSSKPRSVRNCGECLMNAVEIVELDVNGKCPRCGADYGPEARE